MDNRNTYLSAFCVTRSTVTRYLLTILGGLLTAFFGMGLVMTMTDETMRQDWYVAVIMLIPSVWMLWKGIRAGRDLELARRYDTIFAMDTDGTVTLEELMMQTGKAGAQIHAELERLFRKGFFQGCTLRKQPLAVMLTGTKKTGPRYVTVVCPHCGGSTRLPVGGSGKCDYCDSAIKAE